MKVLSIQQPWASLIIHGTKRYETRRWATRHRGPLAIHAGRRFRAPQRRLCTHPPIRDLLAAAGALPLGCVLGVVNVVDCVPASDIAEQLDPRERQLGDYGDEHYAWLLAEPVALTVPVPYSGQLGLCDLPEEIAAALFPVF
jgi:activating signal cointegrator 1